MARPFFPYPSILCSFWKSILHLPAKAIKALTPAEYAATTRAKREATKAGKQFAKQPKKVAEKIKSFR